MPYLLFPFVLTPLHFSMRFHTFSCTSLLQVPYRSLLLASSTAGVTLSIRAAALPSIGRASIGAAASVNSQWQCARYSADAAIGI